MSDFAQAQHNMLCSQLKPIGVIDPKVLEALGNIPREAFVGSHTPLAYADTSLVVDGIELLAPKIMGLILQALDIQASDKILEIGTGTGYGTALISKLSPNVYSLELDPERAKQATDRLRELHIYSPHILTGNGFEGLESQAPYQKIVMYGQVLEAPQTLLNQLSIGGKAVFFIGPSPATRLTIFTKNGLDSWESSSIFETDVPMASLQPQLKSDFHF